MMQIVKKKFYSKGIGKRIESRVRKAIYQYNLFEGVQKLAVALSGGKDSLTMLIMLKAICGKGFDPIDLCAIHVAGKYTCGAGVSESLLRSYCDELEIELIVRSMPDEKVENCYSCSRARRNILFKEAKEQNAQAVAFGHHREDNIQTMVMNLLHKAEFAGTLPRLFMKKYQVTIIRPLILVQEEMILHFAKQKGFLRNLCRCPRGQISLRKKAQNIITLMEQEFPNTKRNLSLAVLRGGSKKAEMN